MLRHWSRLFGVDRRMIATLVTISLLLTLTLGGRLVASQRANDITKTVLRGVENHLQRFRTARGNLLMSTYYSEWGVTVEENKWSVRPVSVAVDVESLQWRKRGCVYSDFAIDDSRWFIRAVRFINSGSAEMGIRAGYGEPYGANDRPFHELVGQYEFCDDEAVISYRPSEGIADVWPFAPDRLHRGLRGGIGQVLLLQVGVVPIHKWLSKQNTTVLRHTEENNSSFEFRRVIEDDTHLNSVRAWVVPERDFVVTGYECFGIEKNDHKNGYRKVVETRGFRSLGDGVWVPQQVVTHVFLYAADTPNAWCSTTVTDLLEVQVGERAHFPLLYEFLLPLGTYVVDQHELLRMSKRGSPWWRVGDLEEMLGVYQRDRTEPLPHEARLDRPLTKADFEALKTMQP